MLDRHKIWLIVGIVLTVLAVLLLVFAPRISEQFAGEATSLKGINLLVGCNSYNEDQCGVALDCQWSFIAQKCVEEVAPLGEIGDVVEIIRPHINCEWGLRKTENGIDYVCQRIEEDPLRNEWRRLNAQACENDNQCLLAASCVLDICVVLETNEPCVGLDGQLLDIGGIWHVCDFVENEWRIIAGYACARNSECQSNHVCEAGECSVINIRRFEGEPVPKNALGDANGDGVVTLDDAIAVARHALNIVALEENVLGAADVTCDGNIVIDDAIAIARVALNIVQQDLSC